MRKEKEQFLFSVEGETEQWYLEYLEDLINARLNELKACFVVDLVPKVCSPKKFMKTYSTIARNTICFHVFDYDNDESRFKNMLGEMQYAKEQKGIKYQLGYTNICFELWMILHKTDFLKPFSDPTGYTGIIQKFFDTPFKKLDDYKREKTFKKILLEISLIDVYNAVQRAEKIQKQRESLSKCESFKGFTWYKDNPALSLHECVKLILAFCTKKVNEQIATDNKKRKKNGLDEIPEKESLI